MVSADQAICKYITRKCGCGDRCGFAATFRNFSFRKFSFAIHPNFPTHFPLLLLASHFDFPWGWDMPQIFFHCSNADGAWGDRRGATTGDLADAHREADHVVRSLLMAPTAEDWRGWVLHVSDDLGEEIFAVSFASVIGKAH
jgi:hypothetical protein